MSNSASSWLGAGSKPGFKTPSSARKLCPRVITEWVNKLEFTAEQIAYMKDRIAQLGHERCSLGDTLRNSSRRKRKTSGESEEIDDEMDFEGNKQEVDLQHVSA